MSNLTSDAYNFGIESALNLFFKEAALPFAGQGAKGALQSIAAGGARPSVTARRVLGGNLIAPPGSEAVTKRLLANPKPVPVPTIGRTSTASLRTKLSNNPSEPPGMNWDDIHSNPVHDLNPEELERIGRMGGRIGNGMMLGLGAAGIAGAVKGNSQQEPMQGAIRGAVGAGLGGIGGAIGGSVLGAFAASMMHAPTPSAIMNATMGSMAGGAALGGYGGYQAATDKYEKNASGLIPVLVGAGLGAEKASKSKKHPDEVIEGAVRGGAGVLGGGIIGGVGGSVLGAAAGALLGSVGGSEGAEAGMMFGAGAGAFAGVPTGWYHGYKGMTEKYNQ